MYLIVGLGNPGLKYQLTRHNIGFLAIDAFAKRLQSSPFKSEHKAEITKIRLGTEQAILAKPQTYMNLSGESVQALMSYYKIDQEQLLVIHDEIEIPYNAIRFQKNRGHGGHNGIRNIHQLLGNNKYHRLRLGVGRPSHPSMDVASYVLQNFSDEEQNSLSDYLNDICDSLESYIENGFEKTATRFNRS